MEIGQPGWHPLGLDTSGKVQRPPLTTPEIITDLNHNGSRPPAGNQTIPHISLLFAQSNPIRAHSLTGLRARKPASFAHNLQCKIPLLSCPCLPSHLPKSEEI